MSDDILALGKKRADELGLCTQHFYPGGFSFYAIEDVRRLLGEGYLKFYTTKTGVWGDTVNNLIGSPVEICKQGLLIGIRPIKQESEERKLLRAFRESINGDIINGNRTSLKTAMILDETKRLLDSDKLEQAKDSEDVGYV